MSKTLTLEIPDEVFSNFQKQAASKGETAEKFVLEIVLKNSPKTNGSLSEQEKEQALEELMKFAGAVNSGNPRSGDNEQIDADLAKEYGKDL
jgi:hypothetical protein